MKRVMTKGLEAGPELIRTIFPVEMSQPTQRQLDELPYVSDDAYKSNRPTLVEKLNAMNDSQALGVGAIAVGLSVSSGALLMEMSSVVESADMATWSGFGMAIVGGLIAGVHRS